MSENSYFGYSLDVAGLDNYEVLVVGAYYEDVNNKFDHIGKVHIYTITYSNQKMSWHYKTEKRRAYYDHISYGKADDYFGISVSLNYSGNLLCVGSSNSTTNNQVNQNNKSSTNIYGTGNITIWKVSQSDKGIWQKLQQIYIMVILV